MFRSYRIINGKPKWVIVDDFGKIINKDPDIEILKSSREEIYRFKSGFYNPTNSCQNCGDKLIPHTNAFRERDSRNKPTGRWLCKVCMEIKQFVE